MTRAGSLTVGRRSSASADYLSKAYGLQDFQLNPQAFQLLNLGCAHTNEDTSENVKQVSDWQTCLLKVCCPH